VLIACESDHFGGVGTVAFQTLSSAMKEEQAARVAAARECWVCKNLSLLCQGPVGPKGPIGCQGPIGSKSPIGCQGPVGPKGPIGCQGPIGPKGHTWCGFSQAAAHVALADRLLGSLSFVSPTP
jgi:hypothetical protein